MNLFRPRKKKKNQQKELSKYRLHPEGLDKMSQWCFNMLLTDSRHQISCNLKAPHLKCTRSFMDILVYTSRPFWKGFLLQLHMLMCCSLLQSTTRSQMVKKLQVWNLFTRFRPKNSLWFSICWVCSGHSSLEEYLDSTLKHQNWSMKLNST